MERCALLGKDGSRLPIDNKKNFERNAYFYPQVPDVIKGMKEALDYIRSGGDAEKVEPKKKDDKKEEVEKKEKTVADNEAAKKDEKKTDKKEKDAKAKDGDVKVGSTSSSWLRIRMLEC